MSLRPRRARPPLRRGDRPGYRQFFILMCWSDCIVRLDKTVMLIEMEGIIDII